MQILAKSEFWLKDCFCNKVPFSSHNSFFFFSWFLLMMVLELFLSEVLFASVDLKKTPKALA